MTTGNNYPPYGSILKLDNTYYHYIYNMKYYIDQYHIQSGDFLEVGGGHCIMYNPETFTDYFYVREVFPYEGKYYYFPSTYSDVDTLDPKDAWILVEECDSVVELDETICQKVCPNYLDKW